MSLYGDYILERLNKNIVESDIGFATYFFTNTGCYIEDLYVKPEFRKSGEASRLADEIAKIAKEKGYKQLIGTICPSTNGSTEGLKILLAYGFRLDSAAANVIAMVKEI